MSKKPLPSYTLTLDAIVGGGQTIGTLDDGRKAFVWGGLPGETVSIRTTKQKSHFIEGVVTEVITPSPDRIEPRDPESYLSTSPWQIMTFEREKHYKAALVEEAFELHNIVLPDPIEVYSDGTEYGYRNKVEFSFWFDTESETLDVAFFRRGTNGKIAVSGTSLAMPVINQTAQALLETLNQLHVGGRDLKTLLIRANQDNEVRWQLYVKREDFDVTTLMAQLPPELSVVGEVIYSFPKSPASVITKRLTSPQPTGLTDVVRGVPFTYATEGFFQINLPVYEEALNDIASWMVGEKPALDMYSGVGTIGLTVTNGPIDLVEVNEFAVREMKRNIKALGRTNAEAVLAPSEAALQSITSDKTIIVDPPRAGLHADVIRRLLETMPRRIIYLSCNPVTQARDVARLASGYGVRAHKGYNFFPRTPHIEHLVVLDRL